MPMLLPTLVLALVPTCTPILRCAAVSGLSLEAQISLWDIQKVPTRSKFAFQQGFLNFWSNVPKCHYLGGGGMCMLFEICAKRPFRKCMGWGGGTWSHFGARRCKRDNAQGTGNAPRMTHYSESTLSGGPSFWCTSGDLHVSHFAPNQR